ncbi:ChaN family lipoprotein [Pseudomonas sp. TTU2014-080ASC]|uniref:ChaN family lipoprotein n=1 Tax=Pseudomonas sp. TTU2014-080ASC TaxID=1729724 RepID=UPI0007183BFB|nr:ChaN family lipoprotein [Pseudomonas sp. TTU2014-080ASC]KRW59259.1 iron(III) ABC transporter [Pseudomonas sp. TTU2014-080ASC]
MRIALLMVLALLTACQASLPALPQWQGREALQHEQLGKIVELRTGKELTPEQLLQRLVAAPKVLVGERHDNPDHHALQLWLLRALATQREQGSLLLEMLTPDQQAKVDDVRALAAQGKAPQDMIGALNWQSGWPWSLYGPLVQYAVSQPYPLLAANLERREVMDIYKNIPTLTGEHSVGADVQEGLFEQIRTSHCNLLPESQLPAMLAVQQQRDRRMANAVIAAPQPSILFAGAYHVRRDLGVPLHLRDLQADEGLQVLILADAGSKVAPESADYVWYTAAQPEQDHCAKFRR